MQGGDYFDYEEKLQLSFGYPAVIAINYSKKKYAILRRAFNTENLKSFIVNIFLGKESLMTFPDFRKKLKTMPQWDGKDYVPEKPPKDDF